MNKKVVLFGLPAAVVLAIAVILLVKAGDPLKFLKPDPAFKEYITAYTSGVIPIRSSIRVRLAHNYADSAMIGRKGDASLFGFEPSLEGEVYWTDSRTIEFRPTEPMEPNTTYTCDFRLTDLMQVPEMFGHFRFQYHTIRQDYEIRLFSPIILNDNPLLYSVKGYVSTADEITLAQAQEMLEARHQGATLKITWPDQDRGTRFSFTIDSIARIKESTVLTVKHRGEPIDVKKNGEEEVTITGTGVFEVLDATVEHEPDQCVVVTFSDLLDSEMDFDGLVRIGDMRNLRFTVDGNRLRVYPNYSRSGEMTLVVDPGVTNYNGKALGKLFTRTINFESMKPDVRMVGEGTVLPSTNGLLFPFEAVNLSAVDVQIQKIYEKNVPQFLQVNDLSGSDEMYRVATTVYNQKIDLRNTSHSVADFSRWSRYALDLSTLIKPERGAIYRVILSFKMEYSTYPCGDKATQNEYLTPVEMPVTEEDEEEDGLWDFMGDYEYDWYGYEDYDWDERNNPCSKSYYYYRSVSRNILSSDIGLIAKAGSDGQLICFTTDIITAEPLAGLQVEVLDFQMQVLASGRSDAEGQILFTLKKKPFLVIAKRGDERGYLKLSENNALNMSLFDVDGEQVKRGIKGFLYAERGVWRPGDTMFIHFILENKQKQLPEDVPVMFELTDPQGNVVRRMVSTSSVKGIYPFHVWTDESSATGNYLGKVYIGNLTFSRYFKVETVKPNRLKIDLRFPNDRILAGGDQTGKLEARWLHGATAPGLKADVTMTLEKGATKFTGFEGFNFDDPASGFFTETTTIFEGTLDATGKADIEPEIEMEEDIAPGVLRASFKTRVFEAGGDFSINTITVPYYPFESYAGLWIPKGDGWWDMLESGKQHQFRVASVTSDGKGVTGKVNVEIYRIDWNWWWHNTERGLPYFLSNTEAVPVYTAAVNVSAGRGLFSWGVGQETWGRYYIRVTDSESGHTTGKVVYFDYSGWGRRSGQGREGASMLTISVDKPKYKVGETVQLTIPSSLTGRALVSIENGSSVLRTEWIKTDSGTTRYSFPVTAEMSPNVYVHITLLQPHSQTINNMPIRMYGVVPVLVDDPQTHLKPEITMPASWEAEQEVAITVHEAKGRPMAYTVAIVDEGLLDLTGFKTPDPWNYFYGKEALGVKSWDIFSEVIGAWTGGFERLLSIGGGDTRINYDKQKTRRFDPVVKTFGPVFLEAGQKLTHRFRMPQYVGSVRVMVVAAYEGAYGNAEKTAQVKSPLMVLGTLPRVAGPGETLELPVNVFAMEKDIKEVQVKVVPAGLFEMAGTATKTLNFTATGDQVINFSLKVKDQVGQASVNIYVTSGNRSAKHTIRMDVRNPNPPEVRVVEKTIAAGQSWTDDLVLNGMTGTNQAEIELSTIPPLNLAKRLDYLIRYPHGCLEQTVSAAFPQLLLRDVMYLDKRSLQETDNHIRAAIEKLGNYMMSDGSLSYWPGSNYFNGWSNNYAGHFMVEAEKHGFTLPSGFKKRWISAQKRLANNWQPSLSYRQDDLIQAYRLYTLALAGAPEMGAMNRLRGMTKLTPQAKWRLAAAYALAGKPKTAQNLIAGVQPVVASYYEYGYTFGSPVRDRALAAETMVLLRNMDGAAAEVKELITALNSNQYYNTQATAYSLIAIARYYGQQKAGNGINGQYTFNGKAVPVNTSKCLFTEKIIGLESVSTRRLTVKNDGQGPLFVKVLLRGIPLPGNEIAANRKISMKVTYTTPTGQAVDPSRMQQGKDFMARITITNSTAEWIEEMALTHVVPSGWQIQNNRLSGIPDSRTGSNNACLYQDIRDDRVLTYFSMAPGNSKTFSVMLNATFAGRFYMPAINCEAMYMPEVFARTEGKWVEVIK